MGLGTKFQLMTEVLRTVYSGKDTINGVLKEMGKRPLVKGSEVLSIIGLSKRFGFLSGTENNLKIESPGLEFMKYIESEPSQIDMAQENQDLRVLLGTLKESGKAPESLVRSILKIGNDFVTTLPDLDSSTTFLTVTFPPRIRIPPELSNIVILNEEAERRVIEDCQETLHIVSPYIDVSVLQMLFHQSFVEEAIINLVTSEDRFSPGSYQLKKLKTLISNHFKEGKIWMLKNEQIIAHAKVWLSENSVLITSANIMSNSQTNNFEMGLYTDNPAIVKACKELIEKIIPSCTRL